MIGFGLLVTVVVWFVCWSVGEAVARALFGPRCRQIVSVTRLPLGLAATVCVFEAAGFILPMRIAAWLILPPAAFGAFRLARAAARLRKSEWQWALVVASIAALAIGLAPVAIAGRFTAAAITNNDGTYYITAADWLRDAPWSRAIGTATYCPPAQCLIHRILHEWRWRTGIPNFMAAISSLSGIGSTESLAVVTAVLFACVPCAAIGLGRALGVPRGGARELVVGTVVACAAAPAFLGYQHMTGHLGAHSLFVAASGAALGAVRRGGWRRIVYAALLFGASVAMFADGALALVVIAAAAFGANLHRFQVSLRRVGALAAATAAMAPFTLARAARAAFNTLFILVPTTPVIFPQRGWLSRNVLDDLATLTGVDAWPPWPEPWPPNAQTLVAWGGALCGAVLFSFGVQKLRARRAERTAAAIIALGLVAGVLFVGVRYLKGKMLLTGAAFVVPMCGVGAVELLRRRRNGWLLIAAVVLSELSAVGELVRPSRWKVVDQPAHDALVAELRRLPRDSIIAFDGLGAPADAVLDAHRAERAALLADLRPLQPGLDGGFYLPACEDVERPTSLPAEAYTLQRVTSETLTAGNVLSSLDGFRLLGVDMANPAAFVAAWAPTHGWMTAEHDADGRIFRWGEWQARGTLHAIAAAPCARLRGEMRVVKDQATIAVSTGDDSVFSGRVTRDWTRFETSTFAIRDPVVVEFAVVQATVEAPDPEHALAVSRLAVEPVWNCVKVFQTGTTAAATSLPVAFDDAIELSLAAPATSRCSEISVVVAGERGASLKMIVNDGSPTWRFLNAPNETLRIPVTSTDPIHVTIARKGGTPGLPFRVLAAALIPGTCQK